METEQYPRDGGPAAQMNGLVDGYRPSPSRPAAGAGEVGPLRDGGLASRMHGLAGGYRPSSSRLAAGAGEGGPLLFGERKRLPLNGFPHLGVIPECGNGSAAGAPATNTDQL
jgi:hypothetical protein